MDLNVKLVLIQYLDRYIFEQEEAKVKVKVFTAFHL